MDKTLEFVQAYLLSLQEVENFGFNWITISFFATFLTTTWYAISLVKQKRSIAVNKSGRSVPNTMILYFTVMFAASFFYGLFIGSAAQIYLGIIATPLHVAIIILLQKHKGFSKKDIAVFMAAFIAMLAMIFFETQRKNLFFLILVASAIPRLDMPLELRKEKDIGVLELDLVIVSLVTAFWWGIYGLSIMDWPIITISVMAVLTYIWALALWIKYWQEARRVQAE